MKSRHDFKTNEEWLEYCRFYIAALAMQGILSNTAVFTNAPDLNIEVTALKFTDALIDELNKEQRNELLECLKYSKTILEELSRQSGWRNEKHNLVNVAIVKSESLISKIEKK